MQPYLTRAARVLALACLTGSTAACATITRGTTQPFTVESTPPEAEVSTSSGFNCRATPCTFRMPRKDAFTITVSKPGYKPVTTQIESKVAGAGAAGMAGNVLVGGLIGITVDATSGATKDLLPNPLRVTLEPVDALADAPAPAPAAVGGE